MDISTTTKPSYTRQDLVNKWVGYKEGLLTQDKTLPIETYKYASMLVYSFLSDLKSGLDGDSETPK